MDAQLPDSLIAVALVGFVPTFVGASLLRAKGLLGLFAVVTVAAAIVLVITRFENLNFAIGVCSAFAGLFFGGRISDMRELRRQKLKAAQEKRERDAAWR